jgi:hypothetical protein
LNDATTPANGTVGIVKNQLYAFRPTVRSNAAPRKTDSKNAMLKRNQGFFVDMDSIRSDRQSETVRGKLEALKLSATE